MANRKRQDSSNGNTMCFTNERILQIAMQQSAVDANCNEDDFKQEKILLLHQRQTPMQENI